MLFLLTVLVNYASNTSLFGQPTMGEISDKYHTLFTPAAYAFSIWGLIYLSLGAYVLYQAFSAHSKERIYDQLAPWLMINLVANSLWLPVFLHELIALSVIFILILLGTLIQLQIILSQDTTLPPRERARVRIPFSLYLGWVSVATITNLAVFIKYSGWQLPSASEPTWVVIMMVVGSLLSAVVAYATRDGVLPLVFAWAYAAIAVASSGQSPVAPVAWGLVAGLAVLSSILLVRRRQRSSVVA